VTHHCLSRDLSTIFPSTNISLETPCKKYLETTKLKVCVCVCVRERERERERESIKLTSTPDLHNSYILHKQMSLVEQRPLQEALQYANKFSTSNKAKYC
jgi:hypothetical protein